MDCAEAAGAPALLWLFPALMTAVLLAAVTWLAAWMLLAVARDVRSWWREYRAARDLHRAEMLVARKWVQDRAGRPTRTSLRWWDSGRR